MNTESKNLPKPIDEKEDNEIDLLALLFALLRGWKTILLFALLGLALGVLYSRYVNPTFRADALIQIDDKSSGLPALDEDIYDLLCSEDSKAQKEAELIRTIMLLRPVV